MVCAHGEKHVSSSRAASVRIVISICFHLGLRECLPRCGQPTSQHLLEIWGLPVSPALHWM